VVTVEWLDEVLRAFKTVIGLGADHTSPRRFLALPLEAEQDYVSILNRIRRTLCLPLQMLVNVIVLALKLDGRDRPLAMTSWQYRILVKMDKALVSEWDLEHDAHWDSALRGSSPLRLGLARAVRGDVAIVCGTTCIDSLLDIHKFCDSLQIGDVVECALELSYPPRALWLAACVHRATGVLKHPAALSTCIDPHTSIIAGCMHSVSLTRTVLHDVVAEAHRKYMPQSRANVHVDDIAGQTITPSVVAVKSATQFIGFVFNGLAVHGLTLSPKSTIMSNDHTPASNVVKDLVHDGIKVRNCGVERDLGLDAGRGKRRRCPILRKRLRGGIRRAKRSRWLSEHAGTLMTLANTNVFPATTWGHQVKGVSPSAIRNLRAAIVNGANVRKSGGCPTTAIEPTIGNDPEFLLRLELLRAWVDVNTENSGLTQAMSRHWMRVRIKLLPQKGRWLKVNNHVVATLFDIGWSPLSPNHWGRGAELYRIDYGLGKHPWPQLQRMISEDIRNMVWARAAAHEEAKGAECGVDWTSTRRALKILKAAGATGLASLLCTYI